MTSPDFNAVSGISMDDPFRALLILIFITLIVERALTAVYATGVWKYVRKPFNQLGLGGLKLYVAIIVNISLAFTMHLDAFGLLLGSDATTLGMLITGLFCSGGAKAWADLYNQFEKIRSGKVDQVGLETERLRAQNGFNKELK